MLSYLLFMDESGHDRKDSPYEVLAGICVEDMDLWDLIREVHDAETHFFGQRITVGNLELKAKKLLKCKTFRHAGQLPMFEAGERTHLAKQCLERGVAGRGVAGGGQVNRRELTALAQAKIAFVVRLLELCAQYRVNAFASIVDREAMRPQSDFLRKDYAYLFERYFYFLEDKPHGGMGLVVFDELERSQCHLLVDQMSRYFRETAKGQTRASRVIPEPFFVHSHLTTAIQLADVVAYIIAWGVRVGTMTRPARPELAHLAELVSKLRYRTAREAPGGGQFTVWSFALIDDLRPRDER